MLYNIPLDYTWELKIASYDAGRDRRLRPSNQLKLQQEVGELHLGGGGLDYAEFYRHGMVFVLTRLKSVIHRAPLLDEKVWLRTWHRDSRGAQFYRCYQFLDENGTPLIESVSAFALVDCVTHKLLRASAFDQFGVASQTDRTNGCPDPAKIRLPEGMEAAGRRQIYWSDTDYNGHLNNTVYADFLCDFMPGGMEGKRLTGFTVAFLREALEGETLDIAAKEIPGSEASGRSGEVFLCGDHDRGRCFEAWASFTEDK
ncbi:MAG: hypothetical protein HFJ79_01645 [Clostridiales bacterium]|jgi:medium-chain acyl-[acyl-carrier-protein] hydrolase|nr:hypothetical protein [Clostridiales bacterium]